MRTILMMMAVFFGVQVVNAEEAAKPATPVPAKPETTQTEHSFEDLLVQGKYHFSDESLTTVEEDKVLNALIGVRQDFKDRLENSATKN